jgi:type IV secretion system protein TrbF
VRVKDFFKRPEKYTNIHAKSPAENAQKTWDDIIGRPVVQNYNLRLLSIGLILVVIVLSIGFTVQSLKSTVEPWVVVVDKSTGKVDNVGMLKNNNYTPQEPEIKYFLSQFLLDMREIPLDPVVYNKKQSNGFAFLTKTSAEKMKAEMQNEKSVEKFGKKTIQINITSVLPMDGGQSYQLRWNEEEFTIGTGEKIVTPMTGIFTITHIAPKDEKISVNPLGLYISDFSWSKDASASNATTKTNVNAKK